MAQEPSTEPEAMPDPTEDTPAEPTAASVQDTPKPEQQVDWKSRYEEAQKAIARQGQELSLYRRGEATPPPATVAAPAPEGADAALERYANQNLELAERIYGSEAINAYKAAERLAKQAVTPADKLAAYEAYAELRAQRAAPAAPAAAASPTRDEALRPKVDANRSDASPDPSDLEMIEEARSKGDLKAFAKAATRAMGFGR